jgi:hypothetical protein
MPGERDPFHSRIREVLLTDWDPSNASRIEAARTTYDGYIEPLSDLIRSHATEDAVVDYLFDREREIMCFPGLGKQRLRRVAQRLLALAPE